MYAVEMLPADHGDCLWVEWGAPAAPLRMLIDGGTPGTWRPLRQRIEALPRNARRFELLVVTHIDADHIGGAIELLRDTTLGVTFGDVWFNGARELAAAEGAKSVMQGEALSALLRQRNLPHNEAFQGGPAMIDEGDTLPCVTLRGGMTLTLLGPDRAALVRLKTTWQRECDAAGIAPGTGSTEADRRRKSGPASRRRAEAALTPARVDALLDTPFVQDDGEANGSSIAFLAECEGARALFAGDAWPDALMRALERWFARAGNAPIALDALKLPHHGSRKNLDWSFLQRFDTRRYLLSTDGDLFQHPDRETLAHLLRYGGERIEIVGNYASPRMVALADADLRRAFGHTVTLPPVDRPGVRVELRP
jgi:beta-lactamase superfamily II metal-dependent hydrolase